MIIVSLFARRVCVLVLDRASSAADGERFTRASGAAWWIPDRDCEGMFLPNQEGLSSTGADPLLH